METMADLIRARREAMALSQDQAVARAGGLISNASWRALESGRQDRRWTHRTLLGVCRALGWVDSGVDDLRAGREPALADQLVVDGGIVKRGDLRMTLTRGGKPVDDAVLEQLIDIAAVVLRNQPSE